MKCPSCQFDNREGAKFCKKCGNKLELECPSCGHPYQADSSFCDECGRNLTEPKEGPQIDYSEPQSYTPKFLADKILTTRSSIEGERKLVMVLFCDLANSTALASRLGPDRMHTLLDRFFALALGAVHRYEGTINQFLGDGFMALFGAPVAHEDHARRAVVAALALQPSGALVLSAGTFSRRPGPALAAAGTVAAAAGSGADRSVGLLAQPHL